MNIEIWFDFTCPFSYVGKKRFDQALAQFSEKNDINVFYHSFCIAPYINHTLNIDAHKCLSTHKDITYEEAKRIHDYLTKKHKKEGILFNFEKVMPTTSKKAHQILRLIDDKEAKGVFIDYVFKAFFEEGKDISNLNVLTEIGLNVGLKKEDIKAVYETDMYAVEIKRDYQEAEDLGLSGVPAFVVDRSYYLLGGQPQSAFIEMLNSLYQKAKEKKN